MRARMVALVGAIAICVAPVPAHGWSNGVDGCNSFGTHDWVLENSAFGRSLRAATSAAYAT